MRALLISSLLIGMAAGPALAGRGGGGGGMRGGGGHTTVVVRGGGGGGGRVIRGGGGGGVVRVAPVMRGGRPYVRERYYDYNRRPSLIVENYGRRPGYYWIPGTWQWDGREWVWGAGRYEVDPNYNTGPATVYVNGGY